MKILMMVAVLGLGACGAMVWADGAATGPATAPASAFQTEKQQVGYAIGLEIGSKLKGVDVDGAALAAGVHDAATGAKPQMTEKEIETAIQALQKQLMAAQAKERDAFLLENGKKERVVTTASGLQYKVIKSGAGKSPNATDTVSVNYRGTLVSGKEFDASHGTPVTFSVNRVIPGWTEALQLMKEGDKWTIYIPSKLAYAEQGAGEDIGPNETLIFEVELVAVK